MRIAKRKERCLLILIKGKGIIATTAASLIQSHCKRNAFAVKRTAQEIRSR